MKTFSDRSIGTRRRAWAAIALSVCLTSCGGGAEVLFVPYFSFIFQDTATNPSITMSLKAADDCSTQGVLPASANMATVAGSTLLTGNYDGRKLTIRLTEALGAYQGTYDGRFVDSNTIAFKAASGQTGTAFTVTRNLNGGVLRTCPG